MKHHTYFTSFNEAVFDSDPKVGISTTFLPEDMSDTSGVARFFLAPGASNDNGRSKQKL
jgi:hypothetical protein